MSFKGYFFYLESVTSNDITEAKTDTADSHTPTELF